mmetsp:Transcript_3474/g.21807  ORF Transcript_3474/g.21807 Transcript_3474/m.21807 type:complete len:88 (-) Transcript_3474:3140-3403(-)
MIEFFLFPMYSMEQGMYSVDYIQTLAVSSNEGMRYMRVRYISLWNMADGWAEVAGAGRRKSGSITAQPNHRCELFSEIHIQPRCILA